ncbi:MAG: hypothetical protein KKG06_04515 [Bacteroidetes bacterium]|nr:hypothetical protein [Nanoarchaeota archaeon]MBU1422437.1 hypothetical protein [Bacteroidota bacterium]
MKKIYSYRTVVRRAKKDARNWRWKFWPFVKDGKAKEPKTDQTIEAQYEKELFQLAESLIAETAEKWKELDIKLKPEYCEANKEADSANKEWKKVSDDAKQSSVEFEKAKGIFYNFQPPSLNPKWALFWLVLIGISEFFINSLVLQILGQGQIETYIAAFGMCIMIPLGAHFFGKSLQQTSKSRIDIFWLIATPVIIFALIGGLSFLRSKYFEALGISKILGIEVTPTEATIVFIIINIALFVIAAVISHEGNHPQHKAYSQAKKRYKDSLKAFENDKDEVKKAAKDLAEAEKQLQSIKHKRAKTHEKLFQEANSIKETIEWLISSYRAANLANREDVPECFKKSHNAPEIPNSLKNLDWDCEEENNHQVENEN